MDVVWLFVVQLKLGVGYFVVIIFLCVQKLMLFFLFVCSVLKNEDFQFENGKNVIGVGILRLMFSIFVLMFLWKQWIVFELDVNKQVLFVNLDLLVILIVFFRFFIWMIDKIGVKILFFQIVIFVVILLKIVGLIKQLLLDIFLCLLYMSLVFFLRFFLIQLSVCFLLFL